MQARQVLGVRSALPDSRGRVSQRAQAEEARSALSRALRGQVTHDPLGLAHTAARVVEEADDAAAEREPAVAQRDRINWQVPGLAGADPCAKVASEQDRARRARAAAGRCENLAHRCAWLDLEHSWGGGCSHDSAE